MNYPEVNYNKLPVKMFRPLPGEHPPEENVAYLTSLILGIRPYSVAKDGERANRRVDAK